MSVGEKEQVVIPKKLRNAFKIEKGTWLLITEEKLRKKYGEEKFISGVGFKIIC